jgi:hypothetical protein
MMAGRGSKFQTREEILTAVFNGLEYISNFYALREH